MKERLEILGMAAARIMEPVQALGYTPEEYASFEKGSFIADEVKRLGVEIYGSPFIASPKGRWPSGRDQGPVAIVTREEHELQAVGIPQELGG